MCSLITLCLASTHASAFSKIALKADGARKADRSGVLTRSADRKVRTKYSSTLVNNAEAKAESFARQPQPPENLGDVARITYQSFCTTGLAASAFKTAQQISGQIGAKTSLPLTVLFTNSRRMGVRWGRLSAGFAGGQALATVLLPRCSEQTCALFGAAVGGLAAAPNVQAMPSSVLTFVGFSYLLSKIPKPDAPREAKMR